MIPLQVKRRRKMKLVMHTDSNAKGRFISLSNEDIGDDRFRINNRNFERGTVENEEKIDRFFTFIAFCTLVKGH
jgi:hypothetical protein